MCLLPWFEPSVKTQDTGLVEAPVGAVSGRDPKLKKYTCFPYKPSCLECNAPYSQMGDSSPFTVINLVDDVRSGSRPVK